MQPAKSPQEKRKYAIKATAKYGGMAFQLLGSCVIGMYLGRWIDAKIGAARPTWAVFLTVFFMLAALYSLYRQLLRDFK